jgi:hypothetical protein
MMALGIELHKGIGVLGEPRRHSLCQRPMAGCFTQQRFRELEVKRTGLTRQNQVVLRRLPLAGQLTGNTLNDQMAG